MAFDSDDSGDLSPCQTFDSDSEANRNDDMDMVESRQIIGKPNKINCRIVFGQLMSYNSLCKIMDLIQVGVSVTGSWKKYPVSVPKRGLPSQQRQMVTIFCTQPVFSSTTIL